MDTGDHSAVSPAQTGWRSAIAQWRDNPLYLRLSMGRMRKEKATSWLVRISPLLIALVPAAVAIAGELLSTNYITQTDIENALRNASIAFIITACAVWFVQGFHQAMLDCMLLLNRSQRRQVSTTLDDLAAVSSLSDQEIAVGALAAILPSLWLRVVVAATCAEVIFILFATDFFTFLGGEYLTAMLFALPTIVAISAGGILATTFLGLWLISLSENYSFSLAGATAVLYTIGALFWMPASIGMQAFTSQAAFSGFPEDVSVAVLLGQITGPVIFFVLQWACLSATRGVRWLRPVFAIGSPWLVPALLASLVGGFIAFNGYWLDGEYIGATLMMTIYQFGACAPLSLTTLPTIYMVGFDLDAQGISLQIGGYATHTLLQLGLIMLAARFATGAIADRRQSPLS